MTRSLVSVTESEAILSSVYLTCLFGKEWRESVDRKKELRLAAKEGVRREEEQVATGEQKRTEEKETE